MALGILERGSVSSVTVQVISWYISVISEAGSFAFEVSLGVSG